MDDATMAPRFFRVLLVGGDCDGMEALGDRTLDYVSVQEGDRSGRYFPTGRTDGRGRAIYSPSPGGPRDPEPTDWPRQVVLPAFVAAIAAALTTLALMR